MRIMYTAGQAARRGTYLDPVTGRRLDLAADGILPGEEGKQLLRLPPGGMIPMAFVMGFLYVLALPFIGILTLASIYIIPLFGLASGVLVVGGKALGAFLGVVGRTVSFGWRPSNAYLAGKKKHRLKGTGRKEESK